MLVIRCAGVMSKDGFQTGILSGITVLLFIFLTSSDERNSIEIHLPSGQFKSKVLVGAAT